MAPVTVTWDPAMQRLAFRTANRRHTPARAVPEGTWARFVRLRSMGHRLIAHCPEGAPVIEPVEFAHPWRRNGGPPLEA